MADYNSRFTGPQIDEAIEKIRETTFKSSLPVAYGKYSNGRYTVTGDGLPVIAGETGKGEQIVFVPDASNTVEDPILVLNGDSGAELRLRTEITSRHTATADVPEGYLYPGMPYTLTYCGAYWLVDSNVIPKDIPGNAATATTALSAATADALKTERRISVSLSATGADGFDGSRDIALGVSGTLPLDKGGTGATSASTARTALGVVNKAGDTLTGNLVAYSTNRTTAGLRNIEVRINSTTGTPQSTNKIIMVRK